ncbi:GNAT family N-acetyltransferase [Streptomyces sp. NPDC058045]|uniref:GNAT family N-acetyltransferase n=1 Tax=Streptomyces sp. NPDC058045 TaxID=3346311 RepID=UPI0036E7B274
MADSGGPAREVGGDAEFTFREVGLDDEVTALSVYELGRRSYAVEAELIGFDGIPALRESLSEMRARPLRWLCATGGQGEIRAFVAWSFLDGTTDVDIDRVCVDPDWFRRGLATRLIRHLLTEQRQSRRVLVSTGAENGPAVALYESLGFSRAGSAEPVPGLWIAEFALTRDETPAGR